jgi:hypothetical protein
MSDSLHLCDGGYQEIKIFLAMMKTAREKTPIHPFEISRPATPFWCFCDPDHSATNDIPAHLTPSTAEMQNLNQAELVLRSPNDEAAQLALTSWKYSRGTSLCVFLFTYLQLFVVFALPIVSALK